MSIQYEEMEQTGVVSYCKLKRIPVFAIPNGGKRNKIEARKMVAAGVAAGVPDLMIPIPTPQYSGLFIEMKYGKNTTTPEQRRWIEYLNDAGYKAVVCHGMEKAIDAINEYLKDMRCLNDGESRATGKQFDKKVTLTQADVDNLEKINAQIDALIEDLNKKTEEKNDANNH